MTYTFDWTLGGAYLRWDGTTSGAPDNGVRWASIGFIGWHAESQKIRTWRFATGGRGEPLYGTAKAEPGGALVWKVPKDGKEGGELGLTRRWTKIDDQTMRDKFDFVDLERPDQERVWKRKKARAK